MIFKEYLIKILILLIIFAFGYLIGNSNANNLELKLNECYNSLNNLLTTNEKLLKIQKENNLKKVKNKEFNTYHHDNNIKEKYLKEIKSLKKQLNNQFFKAAVINKIENLQDYEIGKLSKSFFRININDLPTNMNSKEIINKLIDIALTDTFNNYNPNLNVKQIKFSNKKNKKIYAIFDTSNISDDIVLIKWVNKDTGELILYDFYKINPNSNKNYIWLKNDKGFKTGDYQVEIFSPTDNFNPIFYGEYFIK